VSAYRTRPQTEPPHEHRWVLTWIGPPGSWGPLWRCRICDENASFLRSILLDARPPPPGP